MNIVYLFRNKSDGVSIGHVFDIVSRQVAIQNINIEKIYMQKGGAKIFQILKNIYYVWTHRKRNCIYHITGSIHYLSFILPKNKTITTVHDLSRLDNNQLKGLRKVMFKIFFLYPLKRNKYITCVSEYTKTKLLQHISLSSQKVIVIPNPLSEKYTYTYKQFNKQKPIILHIGTGWNKNLKRTIEAISGLNVHLRIIGKIQDKERQLLNIFNIEYSNDLNISDEQMIEEYKNCDMINFPSEYEGFGLPIIEGQAIGRAIVTSNISPMKEVAGNGAYYVNPFDVESIHNAYIVLINNTTLRTQLIQYGLINCKKYMNNIVVPQYINIYQKIQA